MKRETPEYDHLHELARQAGHERSLYMGEAIGNILMIAWQALGSLGRRPASRREILKASSPR